MPSIFSIFTSSADLQSVPTVYTSSDSAAHSVETELLGTMLPRIARRTKENLGLVRFLWNALFVAIGLVGFFWRRDFETWNALIERGARTQATIYSKHTRSGKSTTYYLDYRFDTPQGMITDSYSVSSSTYSQTNEGYQITVTYLPETTVSKWQLGDASVQLRDEQSWKWFWGGVGATALFGTIIGGINISANNQLRFLQMGKATRGQVVSGEVIRGKYTTYRLHYSYETGAETRSGATEVTAEQYRNRTEENAYFTVLYDPEVPTKSMPYFKITQAHLVAASSS